MTLNGLFAIIFNMINNQDTQNYEPMDDQEWAEHARDYARWCWEVELGLIKINDNKDSRPDD